MSARTGIFPAAQREYAAHGVATFPVGPDKKPLVRAYDRIGRPYSAKLAADPAFANVDGIGFVAGKRSHMTVLDVDTQDERVLQDALNRHGTPPVVIRTASGKFHAWFRHNGERRKIRPWRDVPIDILGTGLVIAPPSLAPAGQYQIIRGKLADIEHLPVMRDLDPEIYASPLTENTDRVTEGNRNDQLFKHCMRQARYCDSLSDLIDVARTRNDEFMPPLPDGEVVKTAQSAWEYTINGKNFFGVPSVALTQDEVDDLAMRDPDAFALLAILRRSHWDRKTFALTKALAVHHGWRRERLRAAAKVLVEFGVMKCVRPGGKGKHDPAIYRWNPRLP